MEPGTWAEWAGAAGTVFVGWVAIRQTQKLQRAAEEAEREAPIRNLVFRVVDRTDLYEPSASVRLANAGSSALSEIEFEAGWQNPMDGEVEQAPYRIDLLRPGQDKTVRLDPNGFLMEGGAESVRVTDVNGRRWTKDLGGNFALMGQAEPQNRPWWKFWGSKKAKQ